METEVIVPVVFFLFVAAVILVPILLREQSRRAGYRLIAEAIEKGQPLEPAVVRRLTKANPDRARQTLGFAVVLLAVALAGFVSSRLAYDREAASGLTMLTIVTGFLGVGFLLLSAFDYANEKRNP